MDDGIVLIGQFHTFLLSIQLHISFHIFHLRCIDSQAGLFFSIIILLRISPNSEFIPSNGLTGLEQRREIIFHPYPYVPIVEVLIDRRHFDGDRPIQFITGK